MEKWQNKESLTDKERQANSLPTGYAYGVLLIKLSITELEVERIAARLKDEPGVKEKNVFYLFTQGDDKNTQLIGSTKSPTTLNEQSKLHT